MFFSTLTLQLITDLNFLQSFKSIGAGCATVSILGSGVGIGIVFSGLMYAVSINPNSENKLFNFAVLGFALTEAIALFGLMLALLILFG